VAAEVVVVVVAAAAGAARQQGEPMKTLRLMLACAALASAGAAAAAPAPASKAAPRTFTSAREAADALVAAVKAGDDAALLAIFGPDGKPLVDSGDEVADRNDRARFVALAAERLEVVPDAKDARKATLVVGPDAWSFPVPIVETGGRWAYATEQGLREVLDRRVGSNELDAITICRGYVDAQREYAQEDHDGDGVLEYAQRVISTPGKRDGLVWKNPDGSLGGPIAEGIAAAIEQGYSDKAKPYHGYHFRVLKRQGPSAPLGALDYVIKGHMIGGFALLAWPAAYRSSGVKTFIVSHDGVVYEKDLGRDTGKLAAKIDRFDPDPTWHPVR
jgi:hypothetical protein